MITVLPTGPAAVLPLLMPADVCALSPKVYPVEAYSCVTTTVACVHAAPEMVGRNMHTPVQTRARVERGVEDTASMAHVSPSPVATGDSAATGLDGINCSTPVHHARRDAGVAVTLVPGRIPVALMAGSGDDSIPAMKAPLLGAAPCVNANEVIFTKRPSSHTQPAHVLACTV